MLSGRHVIHTGIYTPFLQGTALHLALNYTLVGEVEFHGWIRGEWQGG